MKGDKSLDEEAEDRAGETMLTSFSRTLTHEAFPTFFSPPIQVNWNARARQVSIVERHRSKNKQQADTNG